MFVCHVFQKVTSVLKKDEVGQSSLAEYRTSLKVKNVLHLPVNFSVHKMCKTVIDIYSERL